MRTSRSSVERRPAEIRGLKVAGDALRTTVPQRARGERIAGMPNGATRPPPTWLVPSVALSADGMSVTINGQRKLKFAASAKEASNDKWRRYRLGPEEWPSRLLEIVEEFEPS